MAPNVLSTVLVLLFCASVVGYQCPDVCSSFRTLADLEGRASVGPSTSLGWNVTATSRMCIEEIEVEVLVNETLVAPLRLNATVPQLPIDFSPSETDGVLREGLLTLQSGCGSKGNVVPQLRLDYFELLPNGTSARFNGSVAIFDADLPARDNRHRMAEGAFLYWTGCTAFWHSTIYSRLINATVWTLLGSEGLVGALYLDPKQDSQQAFYALDDLNVTLSLQMADTPWPGASLSASYTVCRPKSGCASLGASLVEAVYC